MKGVEVDKGFGKGGIVGNKRGAKTGIERELAECHTGFVNGMSGCI